MIKGLLGAAKVRCAPMGEPVAWAGLLRRERAYRDCIIRACGYSSAVA